MYHVSLGVAITPDQIFFQQWLDYKGSREVWLILCYNSGGVSNH